MNAFKQRGEMFVINTVKIVVNKKKHCCYPAGVDEDHYGCFKIEEGYSILGDRGSKVVKVLCYKSEGRCFDSRWCHWIFPLT
jgi:hypothetical protein